VLGGPECSWVIELGSSQSAVVPEPIDLKVGVEGEDPSVACSSASATMVASPGP